MLYKGIRKIYIALLSLQPDFGINIFNMNIFNMRIKASPILLFLKILFAGYYEKGRDTCDKHVCACRRKA